MAFCRFVAQKLLIGAFFTVAFTLALIVAPTVAHLSPHRNLAHAHGTADDILFGAEFTVSCDEMLQNQIPNTTYVYNYQYRLNHCENPEIKKARVKLLERWDARFIEKSKQLANQAEAVPANNSPLWRLFTRAFSHESRWMLTSPSNVTYWLGVDPAVLELGTTPMTAAEYRQHTQEIQNVIFDTAAQIGLAPQLFTGGGHINIGLNGFRHNRRLLVNFIVDFYNHPELSMGIFGYDTSNAINLRLVDPELKNLRTAVEELRRPELELWSFKNFIQILAHGLTANVRDPYNEFWQVVRNRPPSYQPRYTSVAIEVRNPKDPVENIRLEFRAVRPQMTAEMFVRQIELLQARIRYLEKLNRNLELEAEPIPIIQNRSLEENIYNPPLDPQIAIAHFHKYVTESGLHWADYQDFIWPRWIADGELEKFNQTLAIAADAPVTLQTNSKSAADGRTSKPTICAKTLRTE